MQDKFTIQAKTKLLEKGQSITGLAKKLKRSRHAVSQAINHPIFPKVRAMVKRELALK